MSADDGVNVANLAKIVDRPTQEQTALALRAEAGQALEALRQVYDKVLVAGFDLQFQLAADYSTRRANLVGLAIVKRF